MELSLEKIQNAIESIKQEIGKVIIGQDEVIDKCLTVIFSGGNALLEGVPGVAKTLLVRTLAQIVGVDFNRVQFTPDLMPADITGTNIFNLQKNDFVLVKGPVFTAFLLGDEINRAPAKTQSALLQAMQEKCVTIDGENYTLSSNFTVFATQNPVEYEGTYPLPEAQKDRFLMKIDVGYPDMDTEVALASRVVSGSAPDRILKRGEVQALLSEETLTAVKSFIETITVREEMVRYIVNIVRKTRKHEAIMVGAGPRATEALLLAARSYSVIDGRDYVTPDDIKSLAVPVLEHRILLRPEFEVEGVTTTEIIEQILQTVEVPR